MATDKQLGDAQKNVQERLDALLALPIKDRAVRPALGEVNFSSALPTIERILGLLKLLQGLSLDYIGYNKLNVLNATLQNILDSFKQIEAFSLNVQNPHAQRDAIVQSIQNQYDSWFEQISSIIAFAVRSSTDFAALERDLRQKIAQAEVTAQELAKRQEDAAQKAEETLAAIQKAAAEAGVSQEAVYFKKEADEQQTAARNWLCATAAMVAVTSVWGGLVMWWLTISADAKELSPNLGDEGQAAAV